MGNQISESDITQQRNKLEQQFYDYLNPYAQNVRERCESLQKFCDTQKDQTTFINLVLKFKQNEDELLNLQQQQEQLEKLFIDILQKIEKENTIQNLKQLPKATRKQKKREQLANVEVLKEFAKQKESQVNRFLNSLVIQQLNLIKQNVFKISQQEYNAKCFEEPLIAEKATQYLNQNNLNFILPPIFESLRNLDKTYVEQNQQKIKEILKLLQQIDEKLSANQFDGLDEVLNQLISQDEQLKLFNGWKQKKQKQLYNLEEWYFKNYFSDQIAEKLKSELSDELEKKFQETEGLISIKKTEDFNLFEMRQFEIKIKTPISNEISCILDNYKNQIVQKFNEIWAKPYFVNKYQFEIALGNTIDLYQEKKFNKIQQKIDKLYNNFIAQEFSNSLFSEFAQENPQQALKIKQMIKHIRHLQLDGPLQFLENTNFLQHFDEIFSLLKELESLDLNQLSDQEVAKTKYLELFLLNQEVANKWKNSKIEQLTIIEHQIITNLVTTTKSKLDQMIKKFHQYLKNLKELPGVKQNIDFESDENIEDIFEYFDSLVDSATYSFQQTSINQQKAKIDIEIETAKSELSALFSPTVKLLFSDSFKNLQYQQEFNQSCAIPIQNFISTFSEQANKIMQIYKTNQEKAQQDLTNLYEYNEDIAIKIYQRHAEKISIRNKVFKTTTGLYRRSKQEYYNALEIFREPKNWNNPKLICDTFLLLKQFFEVKYSVKKKKYSTQIYQIQCQLMKEFEQENVQQFKNYQEEVQLQLTNFLADYSQVEDKVLKLANYYDKRSILVKSLQERNSNYILEKSKGFKQFFYMDKLQNFFEINDKFQIFSQTLQSNIADIQTNLIDKFLTNSDQTMVTLEHSTTQIELDSAWSLYPKELYSLYSSQKLLHLIFPSVIQQISEAKFFEISNYSAILDILSNLTRCLQHYNKKTTNKALQQELARLIELPEDVSRNWLTQNFQQLQSAQQFYFKKFVSQTEKQAKLQINEIYQAFKVKMVITPEDCNLQDDNSLTIFKQKIESLTASKTEKKILKKQVSKIIKQTKSTISNELWQVDYQFLNLSGKFIGLKAQEMQILDKCETDLEDHSISQMDDVGRFVNLEYAAQLMNSLILQQQGYWEILFSKDQQFGLRLYQIMKNYINEDMLPVYLKIFISTKIDISSIQPEIFTQMKENITQLSEKLANLKRSDFPEANLKELEDIIEKLQASPFYKYIYSALIVQNEQIIFEQGFKYFLQEQEKKFQFQFVFANELNELNKLQYNQNPYLNIPKLQEFEKKEKYINQKFTTDKDFQQKFAKEVLSDFEQHFSKAFYNNQYYLINQEKLKNKIYFDFLPELQRQSEEFIKLSRQNFFQICPITQQEMDKFAEKEGNQGEAERLIAITTPIYEQMNHKLLKLPSDLKETQQVRETVKQNQTLIQQLAVPTNFEEYEKNLKQFQLGLSNLKQFSVLRYSKFQTENSQVIDTVLVKYINNYSQTIRVKIQQLCQNFQIMMNEIVNIEKNTNSITQIISLGQRIEQIQIKYQQQICEEFKKLKGLWKEKFNFELIEKKDEIQGIIELINSEENKIQTDFHRIIEEITLENDFIKINQELIDKGDLYKVYQLKIYILQLLKKTIDNSNLQQLKSLAFPLIIDILIDDAASLKEENRFLEAKQILEQLNLFLTILSHVDINTLDKLEQLNLMIEQKGLKKYKYLNNWLKVNQEYFSIDQSAVYISQIIKLTVSKEQCINNIKAELQIYFTPKEFNYQQYLQLFNAAKEIETEILAKQTKLYKDQVKKEINRLVKVFTRCLLSSMEQFQLTEVCNQLILKEQINNFIKIELQIEQFLKDNKTIVDSLLLGCLNKIKQDAFEKFINENIVNLQTVRKFYHENKTICETSTLKFPLIVKTEQILLGNDQNKSLQLKQEILDHINEFQSKYQQQAQEKHCLTIEIIKVMIINQQYKLNNELQEFFLQQFSKCVNNKTISRISQVVNDLQQFDHLFIELITEFDDTESHNYFNQIMNDIIAISLEYCINQTIPINKQNKLTKSKVRFTEYCLQFLQMKASSKPHKLYTEWIKKHLNNSLLHKIVLLKFSEYLQLLPSKELITLIDFNILSCQAQLTQMKHSFFTWINEPLKFKELFPMYFNMLKRNDTLDELLNTINYQIQSIIPQNSLTELLQILNYQFNTNTLFHILFAHSNFELQTRICKMYAQNNPIPLIYPTWPQLTSKNSNDYIDFKLNYKLNESIYWLIDIDYIGIVSLGLGPSATNTSNKIDKTELLNKLFFTQFQCNQHSVFDQFSVQLDLTSNQDPRQYCIADFNGEFQNFNFTNELTQKFFSLFSICLLHVHFSDFHEDSKILEQISTISQANPQYKILILVRDFNNVPGLNHFQQAQIYNQQILNNITEAQNLNQQLSHLSNLKNLINIVLVPNLKENATTLTQTIEIIQEQLLSFIVDNPQKLFTKQHFYELDQVFCQTMNSENQIKPIKTVLDKFQIELDKLKEKNDQHEPVIKEGCWSTDFLPARKYLKMYQTCRHEMQAQSGSAGTALLLKFQEAQTELKNLKLTNILKYFLEILNLDEKYWYLATMECSMTINKTMEQIISNMKKKNKIMYNLSIQVLIRELCHVLFGGIPEMTQTEQNYQKILVDRQVGLLLRGDPFECLDGDNLIFAERPLLEISKFFANKRVKSLSILGLQSTGKSTVLNYTFGTSNAYSIGQCTKGMYLSCIKVDSPEFDYLLVIDSEGLGSLEGMTTNQELTAESDNKLILFCLCISQITIINEGSTDFNAQLASLLKNAVANLHELKKNREKPEIFFSVNKGQLIQRQMELAQESLLKIVKDLYVQLRDAEEEIQQLEAIIKNNNIFLLGQLFHENNLKFGRSVQKTITCRVYKNEYAERAAMLGQKVLQVMFSKNSMNDKFKEWTSNTNDLWQTINNSSNIYEFADLKERKDNQFLTEIVNHQILQNFEFANGSDLLQKFIEKSNEQGYMPNQKEQEQDYAILSTRFKQNELKLIKKFEEILSSLSTSISHKLKEKFKNYLTGICQQKSIQTIAELKTQYHMINARYDEKIGIQTINDELQLIYEKRVNFHGLNTAQRQQAEGILKQQIAADFEIKFNNFLIEREQDLKLDEQDATMFTSIYWGIQMKEMGFSDPIELHQFKLLINNNPNQDINNQLIAQVIGEVIKYLKQSSIFLNELKLASAQRQIIEKLSELKEQMLYLQINKYFNMDGAIRQEYQGENTIQGLKLVQKQDQDGIAYKTAFLQLYDLIKTDFQWKTMLQNLTLDILKEIGNSKFTYELVVQIFDSIVNKKLLEIQDNLAPFCMQLDATGKSIVQFFSILIIWKKLSFNSRVQQKQFIEQYLSKKQDYLQKIQDKILRNQTGISKNCASKLFELLIKDYCEKQFNTVVQQQLAVIQNKTEQEFSTMNFQLELDKEYFQTPKSKEQILSYVINPVQTIKNIFESRWNIIQQNIQQLQQDFLQNINQKIQQLMMQCTDFKEKLKINSEGIKSPYNQYLEITDKESQKSMTNLLSNLKSQEEQQEFIEKIFSQAMLRFFLQFISNLKLNYITLSGPTYKFLQINIKPNYAYAPKNAFSFSQIGNIDKEMKDNDELPIFQIFYEQMQQECEEYKKTLNQLWQQKLSSFQEFKTRLLNKYIGCPRQCPLCSRKCDFDGDIYTQQHTKHECKQGHYIRGMQGILINNKKSLSNQTCLEKSGTDKVQIVNQKGLIEWQGTMQQLALEDKFKQWNFERNGDINVENNIKKMQMFWKMNEQIFIDFYSNKYKFPLTKYSGGMSDKSHIILELDDSGSMLENYKWEKLTQAVSDLVKIQAGTNCRFTIRTFSNVLKEILEFINVNQLQNLKLDLQGGGTDYMKPILDCLSVANKDRGLQEPQEFNLLLNNIFIRTVIIFYTDGENNEDLNMPMVKYMLNKIPIYKRQKMQFIAICEMASEFAFELNMIVSEFREAGIKSQICENISAAKLQQAGIIEFIMADNNGQENN